MRRMDLQGNFCRLVVQLDEPLEKERFRAVLERSSLIGWLSRLHPTRRFPYVSPKWFTSDEHARLIVREHRVDGAVGPDEIHPRGIPEHTLQSTRAPCLMFDLLEHPDDRMIIIMTWHHALMDALGAELLLEHLDRGGDHAGTFHESNATAGSNGFDSTVRSIVDYPRKLLAARRAVRFVTKTSRVPIASLSRSRNRMTTPRSRYQFISFDEAKTERIDAHSGRIGARFHRGLFFLASTIRAFDRVLSRRGEGHGDYVIPVPQNLRKRGGNGPVFSNRITFQFFRIDPQQTRSLRETYHALNVQMVDQLRAGMPQSYVTMMELFRDVPLGLYARLLRGPTKGQLSSFFFAYTGETCAGMDRFLGARVRAIRHIAPVAKPPGVAVVFSRRRGRVCATLSWLEGCFDSPELALFNEVLGRELLEGDEC